MWSDFMLRNRWGLRRPESHRPLISGLTIGAAYIVGGLVPLIPYMVSGSVRVGLEISIGITGLALCAFGYGKAALAGAPRLRSTAQTLAVGGLAATAAYLLARAIS